MDMGITAAATAALVVFRLLGMLLLYGRAAAVFVFIFEFMFDTIIGVAVAAAAEAAL